MRWKIKGDVIQSVILDNEEIIKPWGFETADSSAFFSLEDGFGYRYQVCDSRQEVGPKRLMNIKQVKMAEGKWVLKTLDTLRAGSINRRYEMKLLEESILMDFVVRFRIRKNHVRRALIDGNIIEHVNSNIYHQYPVSEVILEGHKYNFVFKIIEAVVPEGMSPLMYVRDSGDEWVVHARMLPHRTDKRVIKLCNEFFKTRPLPQFVTRLLLKSPKVAEILYYRGERGGFRTKILNLLNPNAFDMIRLPMNTKLLWDIDFSIEEK